MPPTTAITAKPCAAAPTWDGAVHHVLVPQHLLPVDGHRHQPVGLAHVVQPHRERNVGPGASSKVPRPTLEGGACEKEKERVVEMGGCQLGIKNKWGGCAKALCEPRCLGSHSFSRQIQGRSQAMHIMPWLSLAPPGPPTSKASHPLLAPAL